MKSGATGNKQSGDIMKMVVAPEGVEGGGGGSYSHLWL